MSVIHVAAFGAIHRADGDVRVAVSGTCKVTIGEDARGDTYRYEPRIAKIETYAEIDGVETVRPWDDTPSPEEEDMIVGWLAEAAHRQVTR